MPVPGLSQMNYQCIRVDTHEGVTAVTLNRP
jgi:hypothetical protein